MGLLENLTLARSHSLRGSHLGDIVDIRGFDGAHLVRTHFFQGVEEEILLALPWLREDTQAALLLPSRDLPQVGVVSRFAHVTLALVQLRLLELFLVGGHV